MKRETLYTVKRAVVMAAGKGERMRPLTLKTPKPLIRVRGTRMIESIIQGLHENGIHEIYVVVGYLKEQFRELEFLYPGLKLLENPYYETCNNISSLYMARNYIEDAMILDGDQMIYNKGVLNPYFTRSGYNCVWTDARTEEWLLHTENGIVQSCSRTGGAGGWQLYSISRWSAEDGRRLKNHLEEEFAHRQNARLYWDDVALFLHRGEYQLGIWEMSPGDVVEIDSVEELDAQNGSGFFFRREKDGK